MPAAGSIAQRPVLLAVLAVLAVMSAACNGSSGTAPTRPVTGLLISFQTSASNATSRLNSFQLPVGVTQQFTAAVRTFSGEAAPQIVIVWSSTDPAIARVDSDSDGRRAVVTALSQGQATITATATGLELRPSDFEFQVVQ